MKGTAVPSYSWVWGPMGCPKQGTAGWVMELDGHSVELGWSPHTTMPGVTLLCHLHPAAWAKPRGQGDKERGFSDAVQPKSLLLEGRQLSEPLE